jgi:hypothetical protein
MMNTSRNALGCCDYPFVASSTLAIGFLSCSVWAHHMFAVALGRTLLSAFAAASVLIAVPVGCPATVPTGPDDGLRSHLDFVPMAIETSTGAELQRPLANVANRRTVQPHDVDDISIARDLPVASWQRTSSTKIT